MDIQKTEAQTVADLAIRSQQFVTNVSRSGVVVFPDRTILSLENELMEANPKRPRAKVTVYDAPSFVDYVNRFKNQRSTIIFGECSEEGGWFNAILDYHDAAAVATPQANWGDHNATLKLRTTPEWNRWIGSNGKDLSQEQFAEFIEDNGADIVNPDAAVLLDMAQFLQGKKTVTFKSGRNLRNGSIQFEYTEQIDEQAGTRRDDSAIFPQFMIVRLTPFVGSASVEVTTRIRFSISNSGKVSFKYILDRPFKIIEKAFEVINAQIEIDTGCLVMLGNGSVTPPPAIR